jgi:hypothetical protein
MNSGYPNALDSFSIGHEDDVGESILADTTNDLSDAVNKIEAELGINPSGSFPTVGDKLSAAYRSDPQMMTDLGLVAWTHNPWACNDSVQKTSQFLHGHYIPLSAGQIISGMSVFVAVVGAGMTHWVFSVLQHVGGNTYNVVAKGPDDPTVVTTLGWRPKNLTAPWTVPAEGTYYAGSMGVGTTMPKLAGNILANSTTNNNRGANPKGSGPYMWWFDQSQAFNDFPAVGQPVPVPQASSNDYCIVFY